MITVSTAELQRQFSHYCELAAKEPVTLTHHGVESMVILSAAEYHRLKALDDAPRALYAWELPEEVVASLEGSEPPDFTRDFNHEE